MEDHEFAKVRTRLCCREGGRAEIIRLLAFWRGEKAGDSIVGHSF